MGALAIVRDRGEPPRKGGRDQPTTTSALAEFVRWRMEYLGIKPEDVAERASVARSTVYRLLRPKPPEVVSTENLHKLAGALEVDTLVLAEIWHGIATRVPTQDERAGLVKSFVLATSDLSVEEVRAALNLARQAAQMARRRGERPER